MNVEILSKMIREIIDTHDYVGLPSVGTFIAEIVPASFSDKGYTINPPYRRLSFIPEVKESSLLAQLYSNANPGVSQDTAQLLMEQFLAELAGVLRESKTVIFPELGRLRATKENNFFFVADPDLDIFPEAYALEPISLRSHSDNSKATEIPFEFKAPKEQIEEQGKEQIDTPLEVHADEPLEEQMTEPAMIEVKEEKEIEQGQQSPDVLEHSDTEVADEIPEFEVTKPHFRWWSALLILLFFAIIALLVFITLAQVAPDFIDTILYTPEELRIIYY